MKSDVKSLIAAMSNADGTPRISSRLVAERFGKVHRDVMRAIDALECSPEFSLRNFAQSDFITERGRTFRECLMTRDGFSFLCMGFTGEEAGKWKEAFIDAFNQMEKALLKKQDALEWKMVRLQGISVRKHFTDIVKEFVEYATAQGSESASKYYATLTRMEYSALGLIENGSKVPDKFRDSLDLMGIGYLTAAEHIARQAITEGMKQNLHYKDIYQYAKLAVMKYADGLKLPPLPSGL